MSDKAITYNEACVIGSLIDSVDGASVAEALYTLESLGFSEEVVSDNVLVPVTSILENVDRSDLASDTPEFWWKGGPGCCRWYFLDLQRLLEDVIQGACVEYGPHVVASWMAEDEYVPV